jgi:hypothetical protein
MQVLVGQLHALDLRHTAGELVSQYVGLSRPEHRVSMLLPHPIQRPKSRRAVDGSSISEAGIQRFGRS